MNPEKEDLAIVMNLKNRRILSKNVNSICDYNQNFCLIRAIHGNLYLIWATVDNHLEIYDLYLEAIVDCFKAHDDWINSVHNFYDPFTKREYVVTCSDDKTTKVWEFKVPTSDNNLENFLTNHLTIKQETIGNIRNAFMFFDLEEKRNFILGELSDYMIVIYDTKGQFIEKFNQCVFHDFGENEITKNNHTYLLTSYAEVVKLIDLKTEKIFKEFMSEGRVLTAQIVNNLLIIADDSGFIKTYDIFTSKLENQVNIGTCPITEIFVFDVNFFFAGFADGQFNCYETKTLTKVSSIENLGMERVLYGTSFIHPRYGPGIILTGPMDMQKGMISIYTISDVGKKEIEAIESS